jgi:opacity protein-like surface antigen
VIRPSGNEGIHYNTGYFFGASVRIELASWMGLRISYREEHVPVRVDARGFDYQQYRHRFDFEQPDLEIITIGARFEPTYVVHPRFRLFGVLGIGWVRMDAPMPTAAGFLLPGKRSATEVNFPLGVGVSYEVVPDWVNTTLSFTYGLAFDQHGGAYEPLQAIVDGKIVYLAPLPKLQSVGDLILTVGVIL